MLKGDVIYNLSFRFRDINLDSVNDINFAINIVIITTTLFEAFITVAFVFKLVIVIVFDVDIVVIIIIAFEKPVFKLIAFDFNIKKRFIMNASFDKS